MRILGIDPGLQTTGFGVIDMEGQRLSYVASGTIRTNKMELGDLPGRLKVLFDGISEVAARYQPEVASVEIVFVNVNPQSTLLLGQARGAALTALVNANLAVSEYTALQMKKALVGHGRAAKSQIQEMVKRLLQLPGLSIDLGRMAVQLDGQAVELTAKEWAVLRVLAQRPDRIHPRESLLDALYGLDADASSNTLEVFISNLRRKIGRERIQTLRGLGYKLNTAATGT